MATNWTMEVRKKLATVMATNWTLAVRQRLGKDFPPDQVLPDKQPSYVRSAVYLFGALTIASFALIIVTGTVLAIFGPQWWHTNGIGHFFNSLHLWSVEAFFFCMVIHLWGMFYLGAWRDGRGKTWAMGAIAFVVSIGTAFTGYLSQSNFDSQWIAVSAKDAMNAIGIGGFFNVLNFGQMYGFHIFLLPALLVGLIVFHIVLVRLRGVVRPYPAPGEVREPYTKGMTQDQYYRGVRMIPYDLLREVAIAGVVVMVLVLVFASVFSSPDDKPLTMQGVAQSNPVGFVTVSLSELAGNSVIAQYGPPYNNGTGSVQYIGPFSPQNSLASGCPLIPQPSMSSTPSRRYRILRSGRSAHLHRSIGKPTDDVGKQLCDRPGQCERVARCQWAYHRGGGYLWTVAGDVWGVARYLAEWSSRWFLLTDGKFYQTDYTKPLLFLSEDALPTRAGQLNLLGNQWGMMNETGAYPGQAWLWLYTFWYQVPFGPYNRPNGDIAVWVTMAILTLALIFVPYIPGLRRLPDTLGCIA